MKLGVVILAAGQGTRMRSSLPKVLHRLANRPLLRHVVDTSKKLAPEQVIVVFGHGGEMVPKTFSSDGDLTWVEQQQQLGTGHAVDQALPALADVDQVLVLYGDVPLIQAETLSSLIQAAAETDLALLTVELENPTGYGRIVRSAQGRVQRIVEQKDATAEELAITEINTGFLVADKKRLINWLSRVDNHNAQKEYYLTDIVELAVADGVNVKVAQPEDATEVMGVNDRAQLAQLERHYQQHQAKILMQQGVAFLDPSRFDLRGELSVGRDVQIDINVIIEGRVELGDNVCIGANSVIRNSAVADGVQILENCVIEDATIGAESVIGPFARIRPGTRLAGRNRVGNFVEIKKSIIDEGSKINHLSYIGDAVVGKDVNIGAGTITCNYDGANKSQTIIGDNAFIGSDSQLVAPVEIGAGATIGAGSTITSDTQPEMLTLSRSRQYSVKGWKRPVKKPKK
ncbi:MAG: bifunctional UDP-N-acetylglucosamine diphosphorylase/glucosamine-1-phosphate N-acetyltransferase GlmU [Candidatus Polarisedimenticolaceae bacterium]|nr:bifunctional UDP-N-acetylglucosamine diphosphorylase/glucosamine-1-phosphate N-acetyltransferase GlmU [Candidatus Polarisedimenticolaceae bacterium]